MTLICKWKKKKKIIVNGHRVAPRDELCFFVSHLHIEFYGQKMKQIYIHNVSNFKTNLLYKKNENEMFKRRKKKYGVETLNQSVYYEFNNNNKKLILY